MANSEHLKILEQGVKVWNQWRKNNPEIIPDLQVAHLMGAGLLDANLQGTKLQNAMLGGANLGRADLRRADLQDALLTGAGLWKANLQDANLQEVTLWDANLQDADLRNAKLQNAMLGGADLQRANLHDADLFGADLKKTELQGAILRGANMQKADLSQSSLIKTVLDNADLSGCRIYGISVWDISLKGTIQSDLIITEKGQPTITVDNLEVAQFIYLLLNNEKIRHVINTITSKVVLILGRFTPERKAILDAIRENLRKSDYLPVLFDFDKSDNRDITETISLLARMARFVIADITDAKSVPQELMCIVPDLPSVPVQPLLQVDSSEYGMFEHLKRYPWVLETYLYRNCDDLLLSFREKVVLIAEEKSKELRVITKG